MNERDLTLKVQRFMAGLVKSGQPFIFRKNWGGPLAGRNEPDFTGCAKGQFWAIELKNPTEKRYLSTVTRGQAMRLREYHKAGAKVIVSNDYGEVVSFVKELLR